MRKHNEKMRNDGDKSCTGKVKVMDTNEDEQVGEIYHCSVYQYGVRSLCTEHIVHKISVVWYFLIGER